MMSISKRRSLFMIQNYNEPLQLYDQFKNSMTNSLIFQIIISAMFCLIANSRALIEQIENTKQIISLYQRKLQILLAMAQKQHINVTHYNPANRTHHKSVLSKIEQHIIFQLDYKLAENAKYMQPNYLINNTQVLNLQNNQIKYQIKGDIIAVQPYQITTRLNDSYLLIANFRQKSIIQKQVNVKINDAVGKWHHATQFQDMFMQIKGDTLLLINSQKTTNKTFRSQLLNVFTINQYKILFATRYQFGYLNAKTLQVTSQINFQSIADCAQYSEGILFVLLKNRTLLTISQQQITSHNKIDAGLISDNVKMDYLGSNYLFIHQPNSLCFDIFEISHPDFVLSHFKQVCVPDPFLSNLSGNQTELISQYRFQFFKNGDHYRFLVSNGHTQTKLYEINIAEKQIVSEKNFPWKLILIIICIVAVVYFKSSRSGPKRPDVYAAEQKKPVRKIKRQKNSEESGEQYIKNFTNQINRAKRFEVQTSKKSQ